MNNETEYRAALEELETIAARVEDPQTGLGDIDRYMSKSAELVKECREYLRSVGEKLAEKDI